MHTPPKTQTTEAAVRTLVRLLTDRDRSTADLCEETGLEASELAAIVESDAVQTALADLRRIAVVRCDFLAAEADFIATATLLNVATAPQDSPRAIDHARKAANNLRSKPTHAHQHADAPTDPPPRPRAASSPSSMSEKNPVVPTSYQSGPPAIHTPTSSPQRKTANPTTAQLRAATGADRPP